MFQRYRLAYFVLLALAALAVAASVALGDQPAISYVKVNLTGSSFVIWVLPALIWYGLLAVAITRRQVNHPIRAISQIGRAHV